MRFHSVVHEAKDKQGESGVIGRFPRVGIASASVGISCPRSEPRGKG